VATLHDHIAVRAAMRCASMDKKGHTPGYRGIPLERVERLA
jgi:hypothetical protein